MGAEADAERFATRRLSERYDVLAPDGSEIRVLAGLARASMAHGTLPPGQVSRAVVHRTVEEIWYVLSGQGEIWRQRGEDEAVVAMTPGVSLTIPTGMRFQFRNTGDEPLCFIMCTMPPWPGEDEAVPAPGHWPVD